jgi:hypothetical protein
VRRARGDLEDQISERKHLGGLAAAAQESPNASEQLLGGERLHQVVVCSGVEPGHPLVDGVPRGQEQHREPEALGADATAYL